MLKSMSSRIASAALLVLCGVTPTVAQAEDVRYFSQNGVTYRETTTRVREPVSELRYEDRPTTVYHPTTTTEYRKCLRTVQVPVTEYRRVTRWAPRPNPFAPPVLVEEIAPVVRWELRTEEVQVPLVRTEWTPSTRVEKVPVTDRKFVERQVTQRVAVVDQGPSHLASQPRPITSTASTAGYWRPASPRPF